MTGERCQTSERHRTKQRHNQPTHNVEKLEHARPPSRHPAGLVHRMRASKRQSVAKSVASYAVAPAASLEEPMQGEDDVMLDQHILNIIYKYEHTQYTRGARQLVKQPTSSPVDRIVRYLPFGWWRLDTHSLFLLVHASVSMT